MSAHEQEINWDADNPTFPPKIRERLKQCGITGRKNADAIKDAVNEDRWDALYNRAEVLMQSKEPIWIRLRKLYKIVDEISAHAARFSACKKGCSHCCHIPVNLTIPEAQMLGNDIKRKPRKAGIWGGPKNFEYGYHMPCPFLKDNACSIYEHRPFACRVHFNLDQDELLCKLIPGTPIPVPYLNLSSLHFIYVAICNSPKAADIRDYFPRREE